MTGLASVTLAITAAAVCYNIRMVEAFTRREGTPIASPLMNHPLADQPLENVLLKGDAVGEFVAQHKKTAA